MSYSCDKQDKYLIMFKRQKNTIGSYFILNLKKNYNQEPFIKLLFYRQLITMIFRNIISSRVFEYGTNVYLYL